MQTTFKKLLFPLQEIKRTFIYQSHGHLFVFIVDRFIINWSTAWIEKKSNKNRAFLSKQKMQYIADSNIDKKIFFTFKVCYNSLLKRKILNENGSNLKK